MREIFFRLLSFVALTFLIFSSDNCLAQKTQRDTLSFRKATLGIGLGVGTSSSLIGLNKLWYADFPRSSFHFFNDNNEWLQMDKCGHFASSYNVGRLGIDAFRWSGFSENKSVFLGGSIGLMYLTCVEILDGTSSQWGFSWGDEIANVGGASLAILQEKIWKQQRITFKFSYSPSPFAAYNEAQLGHNFQQRILKDYNAQTYWASINVHSFLASGAAFPKWMNVAIGYGANEMIYAKMNHYDVNNFQRTRELYFSFDADLNRIRWPKKWMKTTAKILSFVKLPSPTIRIQSDGQVKLYPFFF